MKGEVESHMNPTMLLQNITFTTLGLIVTVFGLFSLNNLILLWRSNDKLNENRPVRGEIVGVRESPFVTIQVATYNEGSIVARLLNSCLKLDYPPDRFEIIVVDDSTDETINILRDYEKRYYPKIKVIHRTERTGYKAGALNEALKHSKGEFILILDADSMIEPSFLKNVIPLFLSDEKLGFVQGGIRYLNNDDTWLTRALAIANDWFVSFTQKALSRFGMFMGFVGHGGVIRRSALEDIGGWMGDTLSEDMDIAYRLQLNGWRAKYVEEAISMEEIPPNYYSAAIRFKRHFRGTLQNLIKHWRSIVKHKKLNLIGKTEAIIQLSYPLVYLLGLLSLALAALTYILVPGAIIDKFWLSNIGFLFSAVLLLFSPYVALVMSSIPAIILIIITAFVMYILSLTGRVKVNKIVDLKGMIGLTLIWNDNIINFLTSLAEMVAGKPGEWVPTRRAGRTETSEGNYEKNKRLKEALIRIAASLVLTIIFVTVVISNFSLSSFGLLIPAVLWSCSAYLLMNG